MLDIKINNILKEAGIDEAETSELGSGFNSTAHLVKASTGKYVLLVVKQGSTKISSDYLHQAAVLEALSSIDYQYTPKLIACADDGSWIITTFHEGSHTKEFVHSDTSTKMTIGRAMVDAHQAMRSLDFDTCSRVFEKYGLELAMPSKGKVEDYYTFKAWSEVQKYVDDEELIAWLEPLVARELKRLKAINTAQAHLYFMHGDLSTLNVIVGGDLQVVFIDWELARFEWVPDETEELGLPYMFIHNKFFADIEDEIIEYAAKKEELEVNALRENIGSERKMIELNDVLWAANMLWQAKKNIIEESPEVFEPLLKERKELFKKKYL